MKSFYLRMLPLFWIIPIALSLSILSSCGQKTAEETTEALIEASTGEKVEIEKKGDKIEMEVQGVKTTIDEGQHKWPSDIPNDVPEFKDGKIERVATSNGPDYQGWSVFFQNVEMAALDSYDQALKNAGFETMSFKMAEGGSVSGQKGSLIVSCMFNKEEGGFMLTVHQGNN